MVPGQPGTGSLAERGTGEDQGRAGRREETDSRALARGRTRVQITGRQVATEQKEELVSGQAAQGLFFTRTQVGLEPRTLVPWPVLWAWDIGCIQPVEWGPSTSLGGTTWVSLPITALTEKNARQKS